MSIDDADGCMEWEGGDLTEKFYQDRRTRIFGRADGFHGNIVSGGSGAAGKGKRGADPAAIAERDRAAVPGHGFQFGLLPGHGGSPAGGDFQMTPE